MGIQRFKASLVTGVWGDNPESLARDNEGDYVLFSDHNDVLDKELLKEITERDYWEDKATELANLIADKYGLDIGEHSSSNNPVQNAIDEIRYD